MNTPDILLNLLLGGLLGIVGQGIRMIIGLKKLNDDKVASAATGQQPDDFSVSRLWVSIFIGFIAGTLGMLVKYLTNTAQQVNLTPELIVGIIAGGYSGVDFIEGIFNKYIPKPPAANGQPLVVHDEAKL
jgi:hypothetical protein